MTTSRLTPPTSSLVAFLLVVASALLACGCGERDGGSASSSDGKKQGGAAAVPPAAALPDDLFADAPPADARPLAEVRRDATAGARVVFSGYIGGRAEPFTTGRAMFVVADRDEAPPCTDGCPVAWDACCTPRDVIAANSAAVQVVDAAGQLVRTSLEGKGGLAPGADVVVEGVVRLAGDATMVVDAARIHVAAR